MITPLLPGGLGAKTLIAYARNYNVELTMDEAVPLCKLWKDTFPETVNYLENPGPELDETAPRSLPTDDPKTRKLKDIYRYKCVTLTGRKRARCSYTQACNTGFQGLASDCTKTAMWNIYKSGYPMCNMIHDETITLIPFDPLTTQRATHIQELMVNSMQLLTPDVKVKAEPALMFRWAKSAEPYFFRGQLLPWEIVPKKKEIKKGEVKISPIEEQDLTVAQITELTDTIERLYEMSEKARKATLNT